jgi:hypothetical protein
MSVVLEDNTGLFKFSSPLHINGVVGIHHDVADRGILEERLKWTQPKHLIEYLASETVPIGRTQWNTLLAYKLRYDTEELLAALTHTILGLYGRNLLKVEPLEQLMMNRRLEGVPHTFAKSGIYPDFGHNRRPGWQGHVKRSFRHASFLDYRQKAKLFFLTAS